MKLFVASLALCLALGHAAPSVDAVSGSLMQAAVRAKWGAYKATHGKTYHGDEDKVRMQKFLEHTVAIEQHNEKFARGEESYSRAHNHFSDMNKNELRSKLGFRAPAEGQGPNATRLPVSAAVRGYESWDWRDHGIVTPIRNQENCGSCYAFAAIGSVEAAYVKQMAQYGQNVDVYSVDFSEQNVVDCSPTDGGCGGGFPYNTLNYIRERSVVEEYAVPYRGDRGQCQQLATVMSAAPRQIVMLQKGDEEGMKNALVQHGPITVGFQVTQEFMGYQSGVFDHRDCLGKARQDGLGGHAVLVVGYGTENNKNYWLIKNSWGTEKGEDGYYKMARGKNLCGVADWPAFPIL
jgi:C1A family cysteine protease